jgi:trehalose-6-phosphatase
MEIGVAWVNKHGCFFFDGNTIKNLLEKEDVTEINTLRGEVEAYISQFPLPH